MFNTITTIDENLHDLVKYPALLKKYSQQDIGLYFEQLIKIGNIEHIDTFLQLPFPKNKEVGVYIWNKKSNAFSFYPSYATLALTHNHTSVFEYFQHKKPFESDSIFYRLCAENNIAMIDYLLEKFPPTNIASKTELLVSAINDNFVDQFKLLLTHHKNSISSSHNEELLIKACLDNKPEFIIVLMIDCSMVLSDNMKQWLAGDNITETAFDYPGKLVMLRELNATLHKTMPNKQSNCAMHTKI